MKRNISSKTVFIMAVLLAGIMMFTAACSSESSQTVTPEEADKAKDELLEKVVPPEDFDPVGDYDDEMSKRATMTISSEDGKLYRVLINWGSGSKEMTVWEFEGEFDRDGGMIPYNNCRKTNIIFDENGNEKDEVVYEDGKGALLFYENGFEWEDKKEDAGKGCHFVKPE